ncbi:MAG: transglycosylase SLT domain-containing protein [Syntrophaceae bacterium]|nr:transglycosylase SLT domain-containing protein [Syntrophaceae bacterium]
MIFSKIINLSRFTILLLMSLLISGCGQITSTSMGMNNPSSPQSLVAAIKLSEPLTFCGEEVPLYDNTIKERLERELLICLDNKDDIIMWIKRTNRYFPYVENILKNNSMPDDLKYIAVAESALRTHASSNKGAVGYWQFIEPTAVKYGLTVNNDIDERRNFFLSTNAAIRYLRELYNIFGSWTLAAAAYNMGEDGLKTEILVQKANNYYNLYLFQETQRYIFRILAIKMILSNPEKYGYFLSNEDLYNPIDFDQVQITTDQPVPLNIISEAANTYFKTIRELNPQIRNYYLPTGSFILNIPKGASLGFAERFDNILSKWIKEKDNQLYTVQSGDNLSLIAERLNVSVKALMIWNGLTSTSKLAVGQKIFVFPVNNEPPLEQINE